MSRPRPIWVIWYAVVLHLVWAVLLILDPAALYATATSIFTPVPRPVLVLLFTGVAVSAAWGELSAARHRPTAVSLLMLAPQQVVLTLSAVAAVSAIWASQYGDGVARPRAFIFADQAPVILTAILHTIAVIELHTHDVRAAIITPRVYQVAGREGVGELVKRLYDRVLADPTLRPYFDGVNVVGLQQSMFATLLGAEQFDRDALRAAHARLDVTDVVFDRMLDHVRAVLATSSMSGRDLNRASSALRKLRGVIVSDRVR